MTCTYYLFERLVLAPLELGHEVISMKFLILIEYFMVRFLHHCATTIQRHFRGHKGREIYRRLVQVRGRDGFATFFYPTMPLTQRPALVNFEKVKLFVLHLLLISRIAKY